MSFTTRELEMMQAYAYGYCDGDNNRRYINNFVAASQEYTAFALGYEAGSKGLIKC